MEPMTTTQTATFQLSGAVTATVPQTAIQMFVDAVMTAVRGVPGASLDNLTLTVQFPVPPGP